MPKARRRDAPPETPAPLAEPQKVAQPANQQIVVLDINPLQAKVGAWHKRLNWVSGGMALSYKAGATLDDVRVWKEQLSIIDAGLAECLAK